MDRSNLSNQIYVGINNDYDVSVIIVIIKVRNKYLEIH